MFETRILESNTRVLTLKKYVRCMQRHAKNTTDAKFPATADNKLAVAGNMMINIIMSRKTSCFYAAKDDIQRVVRVDVS